MTEYRYTEREFFEKMDSEGGFFDFYFGYGVRAEDVEPGYIRDMLECYAPEVQYVKVLKEVIEEYEHELDLPGEMYE